MSVIPDEQVRSAGDAVPSAYAKLAVRSLVKPRAERQTRERLAPGANALPA